MVRRIAGLLVAGVLLVSLNGCTLFWGTENGHKFADQVSESKDGFDDGTVFSSRHGISHLQVILHDFHEMHRFWDRYFMNYDWEDPYIMD